MDDVLHNRLTGQESLAQENAGSFSQMAKESTGESPRNFHKATVSLRKILRSFAKFNVQSRSDDKFAYEYHFGKARQATYL